MPRGAKPKVYPQEMVQKVAAMYADGQTQDEIANALNTSQKVIWNLMRRHGLKARVAAKRNQWGENNHMWKGDDATLDAFHRRLYSRFGKPSRCWACGTESAGHYDFANLSGQYEDLEDYAPMCRSCHWKYDDKVRNITGDRRENA